MFQTIEKVQQEENAFKPFQGFAFLDIKEN